MADFPPDASGPATSRLRVVVMGVSGSGKTTVGELLAARLGVEYADGDDFHSDASRAKLAAGTPLEDDDRMPWLDAIGEWLASRKPAGGVVSCSALKRRYRNVLRQHVAEFTLLYCEGSRELIADRVSNRSDHFMPASLLRSQFADLEPPGSDERAVTVDVAGSPEEMVEAFLTELTRLSSPGRRDPGMA